MAVNLQKHIDKISWTVADKFLFVIFGLLTLIQMRFSDPNEYGLFGLMLALHTWLFVISDAFALQGIIQFGINPRNESKANLLALLLHSMLICTVALSIYLLSDSLAELFNEVRFSLVAIYFPVIAIVFIPRTFCIKLMYRDHKINKVFYANLAFFGTIGVMTVYYIFAKEFLTFSDIAYIYTVGALISSIISIILVFNKLKFSINGDLRIKQLLSFSIPFTISGLFHYAPRSLDLVIIQMFFSTTAVGIYYSAKTLFRFFEDGLNAAHSLVYPAAVRLLHNKDMDGLNSLVSKAISFMFLGYLFFFIILQSGLSDFIISTFLPESYINSIGQFNLLLVAALFLPFGLLYVVITAFGKHKSLMYIVITSSILSISVFYIIGLTGRSDLIPLGTIMYALALGTITTIFANRKLNLAITFMTLYRGISDSINYIKYRKQNLN